MKVADNHIHKPSMNIINFYGVADNYSQLIIIFTTDNDIHKFYQLKASKMILIAKINCDLVHGALDKNVKLTSYAHTHTHLQHWRCIVMVSFTLLLTLCIYKTQKSEMHNGENQFTHTHTCIGCKFIYMPAVCTVLFCAVYIQNSPAIQHDVLVPCW